MSTELAATPDNFEAQLEASEAAANDQPGDDGDSSPANDNGSSWRSEVDDDGGHPLNPHQSRDLRDITDAQDTQRDDGDDGEDEYEDEQPGDDEEGGEDIETEDGEALTFEQLQQMHQELLSPNLPESLHDRMVTVTEDGREYQVPISELKQGYMRMRNYSRGKAEAAQSIKQAQTIIQNMRGMTQTWRDNPDAIIHGMKRLGAEKAFDAAVYKRAVELHELSQMSPEQRQIHDAKLELEAERARIRQEAQQLQRQRPKPEDQYRPQMEQYVAQVVPQLFEQHQIRQSPVAMGYLAEHVRTLWNGQGDTLQAALEQAVAATAEELQWLAQQHAGYYPQPANDNGGQQPQMRRQRQPQPLGPRRLPAGGSPNGRPQRGGARGGGSVNDFAAMIERIGK